MCKVLNVSRSTYYYESKPKKDETQLVTDIVEIFRRSRNNYRVPVLSEGKVSSFDGQLTRKIKHELNKMGQQVSRRRIGWIMKQEGLVWNYTVAQFKPHTAKVNKDKLVINGIISVSL